MAKWLVETDKMREAGTEIGNSVRKIKNLTNDLKMRIDRMTTTTFEWEGNAADAFVSKVDTQLEELKFALDKLNDYAIELADASREYEIAANNATI